VWALSIKRWLLAGTYNSDRQTKEWQVLLLLFFKGLTIK